MKAFLLTAALAITGAGSLFAQNLFQNFPPTLRWDVGVNYGASVITRPSGPDNGYTGNSTNIVPDYSICVQYAISPNWNVQFDLGSRKWESYGTWSQPYLNGTSLKPQQVSFLIGKPVISQSVKLNYMMPFYSAYNNINRANLTFGIEAGLVETVNDGSVGYSKYNNLPDSSYRYVSSIHYGFGIGYSVGVQAGYTYYFLPRWGVSAEIAARYVSIGTEVPNGLNANHDQTKLNMLYFPETFGIKYRFR